MNFEAIVRTTRRQRRKWRMIRPRN